MKGMMEKYYIRSDDGLVLGLRWNRSARTIALCGPMMFAGQAKRILIEFFGVDEECIEEVTIGAHRGRWAARKPAWVWERNIVKLKHEYYLERTRSFRRLCR